MALKVLKFHNEASYISDIFSEVCTGNSLVTNYESLDPASENKSYII